MFLSSWVSLGPKAAHALSEVQAKIRIFWTKRKNRKLEIVALDDLSLTLLNNDTLVS